MDNLGGFILFLVIVMALIARNLVSRASRRDDFDPLPKDEDLNRTLRDLIRQAEAPGAETSSRRVGPLLPPPPPRRTSAPSPPPPRPRSVPVPAPAGVARDLAAARASEAAPPQRQVEPRRRAAAPVASPALAASVASASPPSPAPAARNRQSSIVNPQSAIRNPPLRLVANRPTHEVMKSPPRPRGRPKPIRLNPRAMGLLLMLSEVYQPPLGLRMMDDPGRRF
jgi:hypothetical protein